MAAQAGRDMLIKWTVSSVLTVLAGLRTTKFKSEVGTIVVTSADSDGRWRELLNGGAIKSLDVTGSGVFKDDAAYNAAMADHLAGTHRQAEITIPGLGTFAGLFAINSIEFDGAYEGEVTYSVSLQSAGTMTFTAAA